LKIDKSVEKEMVMMKPRVPSFFLFLFDFFLIFGCFFHFFNSINIYLAFLLFLIKKLHTWHPTRLSEVPCVRWLAQNWLRGQKLQKGVDLEGWV